MRQRETEGGTLTQRPVREHLPTVPGDDDAAYVRQADAAALKLLRSVKALKVSVGPGEIVACRGPSGGRPAERRRLSQVGSLEYPASARPVGRPPGLAQLRLTTVPGPTTGHSGGGGPRPRSLLNVGGGASRPLCPYGGSAVPGPGAGIQWGIPQVYDLSECAAVLAAINRESRA